MTYDTENIFAKILRGEIPSTPIFENDHVLAFHDLYPQAKIHILVIPKGAFIDAVDFYANANDEQILSFHRAVAHITTEHGLAQDGLRLIANSGDFGGQEIPHYHLHLLGGEALPPMLMQKK